MKELKRILGITLYIMGLFLVLSSCAEKKTYVEEPDPMPVQPEEPDTEPEPDPEPEKPVAITDLCRIGNDVLRLSVTTESFYYGQLYLSSTTEFSSSSYESVDSEETWSTNSNGKQRMYPFYLSGLEIDRKYYYYVADKYENKISSGSFVLKDIKDVLSIKTAYPLKNGLDLTLSVPVWFLNIISDSRLDIYPKGENSTTGSRVGWEYGHEDEINHEIRYTYSGYPVDASTEYNYVLYFKTIEFDGWRRHEFYTTLGSGTFTTTAK